MLFKLLVDVSVLGGDLILFAPYKDGSGCIAELLDSPVLVHWELPKQDTKDWVIYRESKFI